MSETQMPPIGAPPVITAPRPAVTQREEIPGVPQELLERARAAQLNFTPGGVAGPYARVPAPPASRAVDPLSQPFKLPSGGIFYQKLAPGHTGEILISPMRGEQEETIASAADLPNAGAAALRHVTSQCFDTKGIPFPELLLLDWNSALLQFYAQSVGDDTLEFGQLIHPTCGQSDNYKLKLSELPSTSLRAAQPGEPANWPASAPLNPEELAILAIEGKAGAEIRVISEVDATEPFKIRLKNGTEIAWRYARVRDLVVAEEYISALGGIASAIGSQSGKFNNFLTALHIVAINGKVVSGSLEALNWIKSSPTWLLEGLRKDILDRSFGYETEPRLRCKKCGGSWKVDLPTEGGLFRSPGT
jgi:hypothetical protein